MHRLRRVHSTRPDGVKLRAAPSVHTCVTGAGQTDAVPLPSAEVDACIAPCAMTCVLACPQMRAGVQLH